MAGLLGVTIFAAALGLLGLFCVEKETLAIHREWTEAQKRSFSMNMSLCSAVVLFSVTILASLAAQLNSMGIR